MEKLIIIEEQMLRYLLNQASQNCVGKACKRFEIHNDPVDQKKAIKEVLYESFRDLGNNIINCSQSKDSIRLENGNNKK
jgi:hypothetical protein